ncbi:uncharacterized protein [Anabrus simplex]|uniref:uncharacterized protein isoform X1 n=1 Tax=Anabrus simplex TaxID=316456 RepID=UPI0035A31998
MGNGSSVPSALDDFKNIKTAFDKLEYSHLCRIKSGFQLFDQIGTLINQVETLQFKCRQEEETAVQLQKQLQTSSDDVKKLQALSQYLKLLLSELKEWHCQEEMNMARLKNMERRVTLNKALMEEVENGNVDAIHQVVKLSSCSSVD